MNSSKHEIQLNPFIFPSETDARFLLLVIAIVGSTMVLADGFMGGVVFPKREWLAFLTAVGITIFIFIRAWQLAQHDAQTRIQTQALQMFPPDVSGNPAKRTSLQQMEQYIQQILEHISGIKATSPQLLWDDQSEGCDRPTGMVFGFGQCKYICLRKGLHDAFIQLRKSGKFKAVLLHELGHLENQDVNKTIFSLALGKIFFPTAFTLLLLLDSSILCLSIFRAFHGYSLKLIWEVISIIAVINVKVIVLMLLVEIIRSSILRVREHYADVRARIWLGEPDGFIELFSDSGKPKQATQSPPAQSNSLLKTPKTQSSGRWPILGGVWNRLKQKFRSSLALVHPTSKKRIEALLDTRKLFQPSYQVAMIAGLLSGLSLNSSFLILIGFNEIGRPMFSIIAEKVQSVEVGTFGAYLPILMGLLAGITILLIFFATILACLFTFGVLPIVGTVGLQVQAAACADTLSDVKPNYATLSTLASLSLLLGSGFTAGCQLVSVAKPFSLLGASLALLPFCVGGWGVMFFLWLLPLSWIASRLYANHVGEQPPHHKRRFLNRLSAIALIPTFISTSVVHVTLSHRIAVPAVVPVPIAPLVVGLIAITLVAFCLQCVVWGIGWLLMMKFGWLRRAYCPQCNTPVPQKSPGPYLCSHCQYPLIKWSQAPFAIRLPPVPTLSSSFSLPPL